MQNVNCPQCGHQTALDQLCPDCVAMVQKQNSPPSETSGWVIDRTPPDLLAWARQTFDEEDFLADVREIEQTGGIKFEDFIGEIEERVKRRD